MMHFKRYSLIFIAFFTFLLINGQSVRIIMDNTLVCGDDSVSFDYSSDITATSWQWDFGDGNTSTLEKPKHSYASPGPYTVELTINNDGNQTSSKDIQVLKKPVAGFTVTSITPEEYRKYFVDNSEFTRDIDTVRYTYAFDFGDGKTETHENQAANSKYPHLYSNSGNYSVSIKIYYNNLQTCADTATLNLNITKADPKFENSGEPIPMTDGATAFSPNNSGPNDLLTIGHDGVTPLNISIFSRTGAVVFEQNSTIVIWDGKTPSGNDAPEGVYYYVLKVGDETTPRTGIVYLFR